MICLPFLYIIVYFLFYLLFKFIRRFSFKYFKENFILTSSLVFYYFQPSVTNVLSDFLNCTKIGENYHLSNYLEEQCTNNNRYFIWTLILVIPSLLIYTFFFPGIAFLYMFANRKRLYDADTIYKIGFMLNGFVKEKFYWYLISYLYIDVIFIYIFFGILLVSFSSKNNPNQNIRNSIISLF